MLTPTKNIPRTHGGFNSHGNILISDQFNNRVVEINIKGEIVWSYGLGPTDFSTQSIIGVNDAQRVGKYTLMAGTGTPAGVISQAPGGVADNRVILVDPEGHIVWQYGQFGVSGSGPNMLSTPTQCTFIPKRHPNNHVLKGTVLITDQGNNRIIEVDENQNIVWSYPGNNHNPSDQLLSPNSAERLWNGNTLIADEGNNRAIEVDVNYNVVMMYTANGTLGACAFASRLHDGHVLLTDASNSRIVEVNANDHVIWQYFTNQDALSNPAPSPSRGIRLRNGNTLISDQYNNRVLIVSPTNNVVANFGLPLNGSTGIVGTNNGYDIRTVQLGLYGPYDAKALGDWTGLTRPF